MTELLGRYCDREEIDAIIAYLKSSNPDLVALSYGASIRLVEHIIYLERVERDRDSAARAALSVKAAAASMDELRKKLTEALAAATPAGIQLRLKEKQDQVDRLHKQVEMLEAGRAVAAERSRRISVNHEEAIAEIEQKFVRLAGAAELLLKGIDNMMASDSWHACFRTAATHSCVYSGPNISHEINKVRDLLVEFGAVVPAETTPMPGIKSL